MTNDEQVHTQCCHPTVGTEPVSYGCAGHFVARKWCHYHLHTHVGPFCISTIGNYRPPNLKYAEPLGSVAGEFYELMVFEYGAVNETQERFHSETEADEAHSAHVTKLTKERRSTP